MIYLGNGQWVGDSSETKPAVASGGRFTEQNTQTDYLYNGSTWINMGNISGAVTADFGTAILTSSKLQVSSLSGGVELGSGVVISAVIKNTASNSNMYVGGVGGNAPYSGKGIEVEAGEAFPFSVNNFNLLRVFATSSGQYVSYYGLSR